jgi:hypothetical protein
MKYRLIKDLSRPYYRYKVQKKILWFWITLKDFDDICFADEYYNALILSNQPLIILQEN